jgi:Icc-related predicted phosphoesterase
MRWSKRSGNSGGGPGLKFFFCTDVHGSDYCFRKFLNSQRFYGVDHLILGGDMTGKTLLPITQTSEGASCEFDEHSYVNLTSAEVQELCKSIRAHGQYPFIGTPDEIAALADPATLDKTFRELVYASVADWVQLAEERLAGTGVRCFMAPGNDDFLEIDDALKGSSVVEFAEARCIRLDERYEMITTGYSNPTPWDTERELPEADLRARIDAMAEDVEDFSSLICVFHAPPYASGIDDATELDDDLSIRGGASGQRMIPVGSTAVREFIEARQPMLALHGHVHDAKGAVNLGRTLCINPGSEYTDGTLSGAVVEVSDAVVTRHQLVAG